MESTNITIETTKICKYLFSIILASDWLEQQDLANFNIVLQGNKNLFATWKLYMKPKLQREANVKVEDDSRQFMDLLLKLKDLQIKTFSNELKKPLSKFILKTMRSKARFMWVRYMV